MVESQINKIGRHQPICSGVPLMMSKDLIYDSANRRSAIIEELAEVFNYRDFIVQLVRRDIIARYKRSVLGIAWTMLNPLGMMLVLTIVFSHVFKTTPAYPVYVLTGLVAWNFFSQTSILAMHQFQWGGSLIHRIYLPKTVFGISAVGTGLVNLLLSLVPVILVMVILRVPIRPSVLFLPVSIICICAFALGVGLFLSVTAAYFWDVAEIYQIALFAWMYLTPVIYPEESIPASFRWWLFHLNPMYYFIKLFRLPLYDGVIPDAKIMLAAFGEALVVLVIGWSVFTSKSDEFAYRL
jgi:ABC-2 type transport system permease protein